MHRLLLAATLLVAACSVEDSRVAHEAQQKLMGMSEVDLEACLGVPDQHSSFGSTDILTYYATSASSGNFSIPIVGGPSFSNGGYCHATFRIENGRVAGIRYTGEKNATAAPDAYCAPIVRSCVRQPEPASSPAAPPPAAPPPAAPVSAGAPTSSR